MSLALIKKNVISKHFKTKHQQTQKQTNEQRNTNEPKQTINEKQMQNLAKYQNNKRYNLSETKCKGCKAVNF